MFRGGAHSTAPLTGASGALGTAMGSQFSMGRLVDDMRVFQDMSLSGVIGKHGRWMKYCREAFDKNGLFMNRAEYAEVFELDSAAAHKQFSNFDTRNKNRVPSTDIFGAIALCCAEREEPKIAFIFRLIDMNNDRYVNRTELVMLMFSVCRGFARIKVRARARRARARASQHARASRHAFSPGASLASASTPRRRT